MSEGRRNATKRMSPIRVRERLVLLRKPDTIINPVESITLVIWLTVFHPYFAVMYTKES